MLPSGGGEVVDTSDARPGSCESSRWFSLLPRFAIIICNRFVLKDPICFVENRRHSERSKRNAISARRGVPPHVTATCSYPYPVEITLNIPDELARQVTTEGKDPARVALEALALEGYRTERLSESAVRQMLGFETRIEVHAFLKQHGVSLHYEVADLDQDQVTAEKLRGRRQDGRASGKPRVG
jgi:uncharacterized protein UPF0175